MSGPSRSRARRFSSSTRPRKRASRSTRAARARGARGRRPARADSPPARHAQMVAEHSPPSKRRTRFFPTASTDSRRRPSRREHRSPLRPGDSESPPGRCRPRAAGAGGRRGGGNRPLASVRSSRVESHERGLSPPLRAARPASTRAGLAGRGVGYEPPLGVRRGSRSDDLGTAGAARPARCFRCDYSDVALLGKLVTRGRGLAPGRVRAARAQRRGLRARLPRAARPRTAQPSLAASRSRSPRPRTSRSTRSPRLVDRHHPARGEEGVPPLLANPRALAQATWRHALFGVLLGRLA